MEVTMDMERFVLMATLIPLVLATALSFAMVALCLCYCKLRHLKKKAEEINNAIPAIQNLSPLPTVSQHVQCETSISKEHQIYSSTSSHPEPNLQPCILSSCEGAKSFISDKRNDSGYEDALVCSFNPSRTDCNRMLVFHNGSGVCTNDLVTKLSFTSLPSSSSSSGVCSDAYYYAGSESSAISCEDAILDIHGALSDPCIKLSNNSLRQLFTPVGYGSQSYNDFSHQHQLYNRHLSLLAPLHGYAAPGKEPLYYNTQSVDLNTMVVSP